MASYTNFLGGFNVTTASSIDRRLILSKNEMLNLKYDELDPKTGKQVSIKVPDTYFALCKDNNKIYLFIRRSEAEKRPDTGWFYPLEEFLDFTASEKAKEAFEESIQGSATVSDLITKVGDAESGLIRDVSDVKEDVAEIQTDVTILQSDVTELKLEVEGDDGLLKRVSAAEAKLDLLEPRIDAAEDKVEELEERLAAMKLENIPGTLDGGVVAL